MNHNYAYIRVSARDQNVERQVLAMTALGIEKQYIYMDKLSGKDFNRPGYQQLMGKLHRGDGNLVKEQSEATTSKTVEKNLCELNANAVTVVNNAGAELPSTGGMGTTIFYIIGACLVLGAGVVLVTRRRMNMQ